MPVLLDTTVGVSKRIKALFHIHVRKGKQRACVRVNVNEMQVLLLQIQRAVLIKSEASVQ